VVAWRSLFLGEWGTDRARMSDLTRREEGRVIRESDVAGSERDGIGAKGGEGVFMPKV